MANNANNHHNAFEVAQIFAKPININQQGEGGFWFSYENNRV